MKNKFKIFITVLITAIICISSTVYASYSYFAKDIGFTPKNKEWNVNNLEDAINDLYENKENLTCKSYNSGNFAFSSENNFYSKEIEIPENVKRVYLNTLVSSTWGSNGTNINIDESLYQKEINEFCESKVICDVIESYLINTENLNTLKIDFTVLGHGKHFGYARVCY